MKATVAEALRNGQRIVVTLDGKEVEDVIEADDVAGYVVTYCRNAFGALILTAKGAALTTDRRTGKVEIFRIHGSPWA